MLIIRRSAVQVMFAVITFALLLSGCGGGGGGGVSPPPATPAATLQSIAVTPSALTAVALHSRQQFTATGTYSDSTTQNISTSVTWSSSNTGIVTVGANTGLVTPTGANGQSATITATSGTLTATATISLVTTPTYSVGTVSEPLAAQQWGLRNAAQNGYADTTGTENTGTLGTDINVDSVYSTGTGYSGWGVTVAVVDSGLEIAHEDLSVNVVPGGSWNFINGTTNPTSTATTGDHGTSVSGLIAMAKNGIGGIGVAPNAQLKGFNFISSSQLAANYLMSLGGSTSSPNSSDVMIFNQSFGTSNITDSLMDTTR